MACSCPHLIRRLGQLPLIGYPIRLGVALLRLPHQVHAQREFAGYVLAQNQEMADFINLNADRLNTLAHDNKQLRNRSATFKQRSKPCATTPQPCACVSKTSAIRDSNRFTPRLKIVFAARARRSRNASASICLT